MAIIRTSLKNFEKITGNKIKNLVVTVNNSGLKKVKIENKTYPCSITTIPDNTLSVFYDTKKKQFYFYNKSE